MNRIISRGVIAAALFFAGCDNTPVAPLKSDTPSRTTSNEKRSGSDSLESSTQFYAGYCTRYAAERFDTASPWPHCNWGGNAAQWVQNAYAAGWVTWGPMCISVSGAMSVNSWLVVWNDGGYGHVAVIEYITPSGIGIAEMNWGPIVDASRAITTNFGKVTRTFLSWSTVYNRGRYRLAGYILPRRR